MAAAMTAALLAGCSGSSSTNATTAAPGSTTAETSATENTAAETTAAENSAAEGTTAETTASRTDIEASTADAPVSEETGSGASLNGPGNGAESVTLRVGSLKGPTSMGLVSLMEKAENGESDGDYEFTMVTDASELVAKMVSGDLDIALVPANMASIIYMTTDLDIRALNINTLGVLYVVAADESITGIADLAGKTVYMTGKGTTPDYVFQYLLSANGLTSDDVTIEYRSEATEVAAILQEQPGAIGLLPQPFVTVAMAQNEDLKMVLDLTAEWDKANARQEGGGSLVTGVTVARSDLFDDEASADAVRLFMDEQASSAAFANENTAEAAELVARFGIIEKAPVAQKALPYCSIVNIEGDEMEEMLSGYLNVLYEQDPASVGGGLPDETFYYKR